MPANSLVFVHYGPYRACGIVEHRTHRLEGLKKVLEKAGHKVKLVEINDWNSIEIWVNGEKIYNCDIRDMDFGGDGILDGLCDEALKRVNASF